MNKRIKRKMKTEIEEREFKVKIHSLTLTLDYAEVTELIELIPRGELTKLKKDLMSWYCKIK